jgi:hypothetical protein
MASRPGYLAEFLEFWQPRPQISKVWMSLYTPQRGEVSSERLTSADREAVVEDLLELRQRFPKLTMAEELIRAFLNPPATPAECMFARTTETISADFTTRITPCQFGGNPNCAECGCVASAGLHAVSTHRVAGMLSVGGIYDASLRVGATAARIRKVRLSDRTDSFDTAIPEQ